jgi:hypothetical protein
MTRGYFGVHMSTFSTQVQLKDVYLDKLDASAIESRILKLTRSHLVKL